MICLFGLSLLLAATGPETPPPSPVAPQEEASQMGAESFHAGLQAYDDHDYVRALMLFEEAYASSPVPEIQFDIGQTYRAMGQCKKALLHFDIFLSSVPADDPLAARTKALREEVISCANQAPAADAHGVRPTPVIPNTGPDLTAHAWLGAETSGAPRADRKAARTACAATAGGAVAMGILGAVFELQAQSAQDTVQLSTTWDDGARRADERGRTLAENGEVLLISAGILAAGAAVSCWLGWSARRD